VVAPKDLLINGQLVEGCRLAADGTYPLRTLLLQLEVGSGIKTLNVVARNSAAWQLESHVGEWALEAQVHRCRNDIGITGLVCDWIECQILLLYEPHFTAGNSLSAMTDSLRIFFWIWATKVSMETVLQTTKLK
jgi:hypothetical protein